MLRPGVLAAHLNPSRSYLHGNFGDDENDENDIISSRLLGTVSVPTVLRNRMELRSGKWTKEEEQFAFTIIQHFQAGTLNVPETATLRQCLSVALNCDAMRISKKFAGPYSIGKQVFSPVDKHHANYALMATICLEELNIARTNWFHKLDEIELQSINRSRKRMRLELKDPILAIQAAEPVVSGTIIRDHTSESNDLESFHKAVIGLNALKQNVSTTHDKEERTSTNNEPILSLQKAHDEKIPRVVYSMEKILKGEYLTRISPPHILPPQAYMQWPMPPMNPNYVHPSMSTMIYPSEFVDYFYQIPTMINK
jgi:hypothetical protein